jgi:hypothetical protein
VADCATEASGRTHIARWPRVRCGHLKQRCVAGLLGCRDQERQAAGQPVDDRTGPWPVVVRGVLGPGGISSAAGSRSAISRRAASTVTARVRPDPCPSASAMPARYQNRKPRSTVSESSRPNNLAAAESAAAAKRASPSATAARRSMPTQNPPNHPPSSDHSHSPVTGSAAVGQRPPAARSVLSIRLSNPCRHLVHRL